MLFEAIVVIVALLLSYYWNFKSKQRFWSEIGVPSPPAPSFPRGNHPSLHPDVVSGKCHDSEVMVRQYKEFEGHAFYGTYTGLTATPILYPRDLDLISRIFSRAEIL